MRAFGFFLIGLFAIAEQGLSQVDIPSSQTANLPTYRPILIGTGPEALINRIDTEDLMKKGQQDAALMFSCSVKKTGDVVATATYRGTPDSKLLEQELLKRLSPALNPRFIPAVYNHLPVDAIYYGTITFAIVNGKPRLRIFSNQEPDELKKESDFIGPQPFFGGESHFSGIHYPDQTAPVDVDGAVELEVKVDAVGNLRQLKVLDEKPPFLGFGEAALSDFGKAKFIPAFRAGKPTACDVTLPVYYREQEF
jgi:TonB family protein